MSETVFDKHIETAEIIHQINCDKCNKCICESEEHDDGYYYNPSEYTQKIFIDNKWYEYNAQLCEECKRITTKEIIAMLEKIGFKKC